MANIDLIAPVQPDKIYHRVFQQDGDGVAIIEELSQHFYDQDLYAPGDQFLTAFNLGQRSVIQYLMKRAAQGGN